MQKDSKTLTVEVKGSAKPYHGIPDLYYTQIDQNKELIADYLCVGYFPPDGPEMLAIIPRGHFPSDAFDARPHYCVKPKYKNRAFIDTHVTDMNAPWLG